MQMAHALLDANAIRGQGIRAGCERFPARDRGTGRNQLHCLENRFGTSMEDGWYPIAPPIQGSDGAFYGTANFGLERPVRGSVPGHCGWQAPYSLLHRFIGEAGTGGLPGSSWWKVLDGALYGTTGSSGTNRGTVFKSNRMEVVTASYINFSWVMASRQTN